MVPAIVPYGGHAARGCCHEFECIAGSGVNDDGRAGRYAAAGDLNAADGNLDGLALGCCVLDKIPGTEALVVIQVECGEGQPLTGYRVQLHQPAGTATEARVV